MGLKKQWIDKIRVCGCSRTVIIVGSTWHMEGCLMMIMVLQMEGISH